MLSIERTNTIHPYPHPVPVEAVFDDPKETPQFLVSDTSTFAGSFDTDKTGDVLFSCSKRFTKYMVTPEPESGLGHTSSKPGRHAHLQTTNAMREIKSLKFLEQRSNDQ